MLEAKSVDAVLVATPHPSHVALGLKILEAGLPLLMEKPLGVHVEEARRLTDAAKASGIAFGAMFNQRTDPLYQRLRELVRSGKLGAIQRVNWTVTDWFRPDAYYRSSSWRATWEGEGGGVLLNQCPHNLDLWQWIFGMPAGIQAQAAFGRHHAIAVEDEVVALMTYPDRMCGQFITSTGEAPGVNRLEVATEGGRIVLENRQLIWHRLKESLPAFNHRNTELFASPEHETVIEDYPESGEQHIGILRNFTDHLLDGAPLLAPGEDGLASLELANAAILSALEERRVDLPIAGQAYTQHLQELIEKEREN